MHIDVGQAGPHLLKMPPRRHNIIMTLSVLVATRNRKQQLLDCIRSVMSQKVVEFEIVILDDASDCDLQAELAVELEKMPVRWLRSEEPSGVTGARNKLIKAARGDRLVFLDDDAFFEHPNCLQEVEQVFDKLPDVGIIAFKITLRGNNEGELQVPFSRAALRETAELALSSRPAALFIGAGHAIKRSVFDTCGLYDERLVFAAEEYDLSLAAINAGFQIYYDSEIAVGHREAISIVDNNDALDDEIFYRTRNRFFVGYRRLPWRYFFPHVIVWSVRYFFQALRTRQLSPYFRGLIAGITQLRSVKREPLTKRAIHYLRNNYGRLAY